VFDMVATRAYTQQCMDQTTNGKDVTINELAGMIKVGFDEVKVRLDTLERGQEDIKLRLDNVAYRFEIVALEKRVDVLEQKFGVAA